MRNPLQLVLDFLSPSSAVVDTPPVLTPPVRDPSALTHPHANRETVLEGMHVRYLFQRVRRKSIGFVVGPDGLEVRAPKWVTLKEVELGLQERSEWVLRKWAEVQERQKNIRQIEWTDGACLDYLGTPICLRLRPEVGRSELHRSDEGQGAELKLALPVSAEASQIRDAVQAWLMREGRALFEARLNFFAPQMGVQWRKLSLSNAGSRWGSARIDGAIRLNWRLIHLKPEAIDYVVVHELAHLREMNHSPAFWKVVAETLPDHLERRKALQKENLANWT